MISKLGACKDLKISEAEVISGCKGLLNVSTHMRLTIYAWFFFDLQFEFRIQFVLLTIWDPQ